MKGIANSFFPFLSLSSLYTRHCRAALLTVCKFAHERGRRCVSLICDACHAWRAHFRHSLSTVAPIHWPVVVKARAWDRAISHRVTLRPHASRTGCFEPTIVPSLSVALYQRSPAFFSMLNQTEKVHKTRAYAVRFARGKINLGSRWEICLTI